MLCVVVCSEDSEWEEEEDESDYGRRTRRCARKKVTTNCDASCPLSGICG